MLPAVFVVLFRSLPAVLQYCLFAVLNAAPRTTAFTVDARCPFGLLLFLLHTVAGLIQILQNYSREEFPDQTSGEGRR